MPAPASAVVRSPRPPSRHRQDELLESAGFADIEQRGDVDVAIATNSGFAASADRPLMSEDEQRAKLRLVETAARYYWGNEI